MMKVSLLLVLFIFGESIAGQAEKIDRIVALVNGKLITEYELDIAIKAFQRATPNTPFTIGQLREKLLDELIVNQLVGEEVKKLGREATDQDVQRTIENIRVENNLTLSELVEALKEEGKTFDEYRIEIKKQIERFQLSSYIVQQRVNLTNDELSEYYTANYSGKGKRMVKIEHLRIEASDSETTSNLSVKIKELVRSGVAFTNLPETIKDPSVSYGSFGEVVLDEINPAITQAISTLKPGEIAEPVKMNDSIFLFRLISSDSASVLPFETVKEEIRQRLIQQEGEKHMVRWIEELKRKASIDIRLDKKNR